MNPEKTVKMKKIIMVLIALCCLSTVHAQWSVTPEAGLSALKRVNFDGWSARFRVGASVEYDFNERFALKSGLYYANRGYTISGVWSSFPMNERELSPAIFHNELTLGYLQLPVMAKFAWNLTDDVRFTIAAGPYLGYQMYSGGSLSVYSVFASYDNNGYGGYGGYGAYGGYGYYGYDYGYDLGVVPYSLIHGGMRHKFDWGANLAVGLEVKNWVMNLTYEMALGKEFEYDDVETKYRTFHLTVGYKFRL